MAPFYFAVYNWSNHLEKFESKIFNQKNIGVEQRKKSIEILHENVMDEKGFDGKYQNLDKCHIVTYINFLLALGFNGKLSQTKAVIKFNNLLDENLLNKSPAFNACLLGGIEHLYIKISNFISTYCTKMNISQEHYNNHEILDVKHSMDLFTVAQLCDVNNDELIEGTISGYELLWNLFMDLIHENIQIKT